MAFENIPNPAKVVFKQECRVRKQTDIILLILLKIIEKLIDRPTRWDLVQLRTLKSIPQWK